MVIIILALLLPIAMAVVFLVTRHVYRRAYDHDELSAVTRQHIELFQGGHLSESAIESAKSRFRDLLERGEVEAVEASMRAGMQYVIQVRALAELGTDDAGRILERQLQRRLTDDQIEQSWYWIDLANGLRTLNRSQSLPSLLRCAESAGDGPLGNFLAAETVCFLGFIGYIRQHDTALGQTALRVLHQALEGLRVGVPPLVMAEGRMGELVETLWDHRPDDVDPIVVRIFHETIRLLQRTNHFEDLLGGDPSDQEAFRWQISRLASLELVLTDYLGEAPRLLLEQMKSTDEIDHHETLVALVDLKADTQDALLCYVDDPIYPHRYLLFEVLTYSKHAMVGPRLRQWALENVSLFRRIERGRWPYFTRQVPLHEELGYDALLYALRGHPSAGTEDFLLLACRDWDPTYRAVAISSLGWWEPIQRGAVRLALQDARRDGSVEVRQAARAALARLGERQSLQWFRQNLSSEDPIRIFETIQVIAHERLFFLWPDVDRLADSEDIEIVHQAREALERLCEDL